MRRRSRILMVLLLVVGGFCACSTFARVASHSPAVVSAHVSRRSACRVIQVRVVESEKPASLLAEDSTDSVTSRITSACFNSTTDLAVVNSLFRKLLDCPRGGGQSLVNRHVRLQI